MCIRDRYEDLSDGIIDKSEYFEFRNSYTKIIEEKQEALLRVKKEMKQSVATGATERNWVTLFKQYENIEELNRRVLMALVDRILIYEDHAIETVSYTHLSHNGIPPPKTACGDYPNSTDTDKQVVWLVL